MAVSVRFNEDELELVHEYASLYNISVSEVIRKATMDLIEDALDISLLESAMKRASETKMKMYDMDEAGKELGFL